MNALTVIWKGVRFHWRAHFGVALGALVATAVLTGAMLVGDSVRFSLRRLALWRLGDTHFALGSGARLFAANLAERLAGELQTKTAPVLAMPGVAIGPADGGGEGRQVNQVQVLGVDERFWAFAPGGAPAWRDGEVALAEKLARALGVSVGDEIALRVRRPGLMPDDAPLTNRRENLYRRSRLTVVHVVPDTQLGRFSLRTDQTAPYNAFVPLRWLQTALGRDGGANMLLVGALPDRAAGLAEARDGLAKVWRIEDVGLRLRRLPSGVAQLESDRIFLDPRVGEAALAIAGTNAVGALSYLVSSISVGDGAARQSTPYSFMTAVSPATDGGLSPVPPDMRDDEIILNHWLADKLGSGIVRSPVNVTWLRLQPSGRFEEESRAFNARPVAQMEEFAGERALLPSFPGLADSDRCEDWDVGMPLDEELLKDKDNEAYWQQYRVTPKAIVTLRAGQAMWGSRFGDLMAVRYRVADDAAAERIAESLRRAVRPEEVGLSFQPVREQAELAVAGGQNLGDLFLGMSAFLIIAALVLTALLFVFGAQQRAEEVGILLATGYRRWGVGRLLLAEGAVVSLIGAAAGVAVGTAYTRGLLWGLGGNWRSAVGGAAIRYHAEPMTILLGGAVGWACALAALALALRGLMRRPAAQLLSGDFSQERGRGGGRRGGRVALPAAVGAALGAVGIVAWAAGGRTADPAGVFFAAGGLLLLAGILAASAWLGGAAARGSTAAAAESGGALTLAGVALRGVSRRRWRSLSVCGLLAGGSFLVLAVSSMHVDAGAGAERRDSGTGGFALFAESSMPIPEDLNEAAGRKRLGIPESPELQGVEFTAGKLRDGDDAGCLNLNRPQMPRLAGLDPDALAGQGAFAAPGAGDTPWQLLDMRLPDGMVPGLAGDMDTATWRLRKRVDPEHGDTLDYTDERGQPFKVKLVGALPHRLTLWHGSVIISLRTFTERFPSESGYRVFLVHAPAGRGAAARNHLNRTLDRFGVEAVAAGDRLAEFNEVENTYLTMFLVLGGLGLALGGAGLGVVVLRNVLERRRELAALRAFGFTRARLRRMLWLEHGVLLAAGLGMGAVAALVAIAPALHAPGAGVPYAGLMLAFAAVAGSGLFWTWLATLVATRGDLPRALREE